MFSINKLTKVTVCADDINSDIYRIMKLKYDSSMYRIRKGDNNYHFIEFEFDDIDKAHQLYVKWDDRYSTDWLDHEGVTGMITSKIGIHKALNHEIIIRDELDTLKRIRQILNADDKYDSDLIKFIFNLIEDGNKARITIRIKCDELVLF